MPIDEYASFAETRFNTVLTTFSGLLLILSVKLCLLISDAVSLAVFYANVVCKFSKIQVGVCIMNRCLLTWM